MKKETISILYVDDEPNNLNSFRANFRKNYTVYTAESADEGLAILRTTPIQIIITDQRMPVITGVEFLEMVIKEFPEPIRLLLTGYSDINIIIDAINKGLVHMYMMKPFNELEITVTINNAFEVYLLRAKNKVLSQQLLSVTEELTTILNKK
ncbi:MAG: response regulator [Bacteroidota bacterium]|nr:response regulator [Bacteroidota bacterium]MDP3144906.1 response regulator [Bacteroidota bacterium]MDP3557081.1 response regulator [Bacteroidota bacterium]